MNISYPLSPRKNYPVDVELAAVEPVEPTQKYFKELSKKAAMISPVKIAMMKVIKVNKGEREVMKKVCEHHKGFYSKKEMDEEALQHYVD